MYTLYMYVMCIYIYICIHNIYICVYTVVYIIHIYIYIWQMYRTSLTMVFFSPTDSWAVAPCHGHLPSRFRSGKATICTSFSEGEMLCIFKRLFLYGCLP